MIKGFLALAIASSLVGFAAQADMSDYVGSYNGKFERTKGSFIIGTDGGALTASFLGANGSADLIGDDCKSSIGKMLKLDIDGNKVDYAIFAFDPGYCMMNYQGRELVIDFKHDDGQVAGMNASLYVRTTTDSGWECDDFGGGSTCFPSKQSTDWYATGKFKK